MQQFELDFEGGLIDRYPEFLDCVRASVYGCGKPFKAIAADLDMSPSLLSQKLSDNSDTNFALRRLPELLETTRDFTPIFWLVERYCDSPESKRRKATAEIARMLPELQRLLKEAQ